MIDRVTSYHPMRSSPDVYATARKDVGAIGSTSQAHVADFSARSAPSTIAVHRIEANSIAEFGEKFAALLQGPNPLNIDTTRMDPNRIQETLRVLAQPPANSCARTQLMFDENGVSHALDFLAGSRYPFSLCGRGLSEADLTKLARGMYRSTTSGVDLGGHQLEETANPGLKNVVDALQACPDASKLWLKGCSLDSDFRTALGDCVGKSRSLDNLNLGQNNLDGDDAGALAYAFAKRGKRQSVDLSLAANHCLGDDGVRQICESGALGAQSGCVRNLNLSNCAVTGEGCRAICPFIRDSCLQSLSLGGMLLNDDDFGLLAQALASTKIRDIDLRGTPFTAKQQDTLAMSARANPGLKLRY